MKLYDENARKIVTKHPTCREAGECRPPHRSRKNRRDWCKGRVGIPHTWEWLRSRDDVDRERRFGMRYNRITEHPVCFGCEKIDFRSRSYCRLCGEPWPHLHHRAARLVWVVAPCDRCGAPWSLRPRVGGHWIASGSIVVGG
jgi:hypothetical protein